MEMLKVFEAFAGYGSQRMALENIGVPHDVVAISEIDPFAIKSYNAIHGETFNLGDITEIKVDDVPDHDLFTYSFPCQDISTAGRQVGFNRNSGTRSGLLWECERIISVKKPNYLLMENVKNLTGKKFMSGFQEWIDYLESVGYSNYWQVLNAKDYGIPQNRERVFMVSILGDHTPYQFPDPIKLEMKLKDILEETVDEKYYLKGFQKDTYKLEPSRYGVSMNRNEINSEIEIAHTLLARDYKGFGNQNMTGVIDGYRVRKLTPLEYFRLMGVKDELFYKADQVNSDTQLYKQAGNSIVVNVLEGIFRNMI